MTGDKSYRGKVGRADGDPTRRDHVRWARDPAFPGIEVMAASWASQVFRPHLHAAYTVAVNDAGIGGFDCRGDRHVALPDRLNLIEPGEVHTGRPLRDSGWTYRNFYVEPAAMAVLVGRIGDGRAAPLRFVAPVVRDAEAAGALRVALAAFESPAARLERDERLVAAFVLLLERHAAPAWCRPAVGREHPGVARARALLAAHPERDVSIDALAAEAALSPFHLIHAFRRRVGLPPHAYQAVLRVHQAQRAIRGGAPIAAAAIDAGFYDQSHLTRAFKRVLGTTPGRYAGAISSKPR